MLVAYRSVKELANEELVKLFKDANWIEKDWDLDTLYKIVPNSTCFVVACIGQEIVGMGRAISDSVSDACIQDIIVLKSHQKLGIGKGIVMKLVEELQQKRIDWIQLIGVPNSQKFYEKCGFSVMKEHVAMKYNK